MEETSAGRGDDFARLGWIVGGLGRGDRARAAGLILETLPPDAKVVDQLLAAMNPQLAADWSTLFRRWVAERPAR